ncbi:MAG: prolyl oligopeptidase family serine peptidase [Nitrososphaeraceae archaeon]
MGKYEYNDLEQDAQKAVNVLIQQPEVDAKKISMIGHSEGGEIATRVATDNPITKFKNIVLMAARIQNPHDAAYYGFVGLPLEYAKQVLDKNHNGSFSLQEASQDQIFQSMVGGNTSLILTQSLPDGTKLLKSGYNPNNDRYININTELKPMFERRFENAFEAPKCENPMERPCPIYLKSILSLKPTLSIIGNVSSSTGILILHGQNDSGSRVQQAFLLQQRLIELNRPDHTLITYPDLGHHFYPSSQWTTESGPIPEYVLADLYAWLAAHSGFTSPATAERISTISIPVLNSTTK